MSFIWSVHYQRFCLIAQEAKNNSYAYTYWWSKECSDIGFNAYEIPYKPKVLYAVHAVVHVSQSRLITLTHGAMKLKMPMDHQ